MLRLDLVGAPVELLARLGACCSVVRADERLTRKCAVWPMCGTGRREHYGCREAKRKLAKETLREHS
jgi:hypothetical protein